MGCRDVSRNWLSTTGKGSRYVMDAGATDCSTEIPPRDGIDSGGFAGKRSNRNRVAILGFLVCVAMALAGCSQPAPVGGPVTPLPVGETPVVPVVPSLPYTPIAIPAPTPSGALTPVPLPTPTPTPNPSSAPAPDPTPIRALSDRPNFVLIITDDQELNSIGSMPSLLELLAKEGIIFSHYFATDPICCPARSSILRGQHVHNHKVRTNFVRSGGFQTFRDLGHEKSTIATWLQDAGYQTALLGKYLNHYPGNDPLYVPKGWDDWHGHFSMKEQRYFNYKVNENGKVVSYGSDVEDYETDVLSRKTQALIRKYAKEPRPFFIYLAPNAPHTPAIPAPRHDKEFADARLPRPQSFDEEDVSDKPLHIRELPRLNRLQIVNLEESYRDRLRSLLAVDEMIADIYDTLDEVGVLDNTFIIFTSDNGLHQGEHRRRGKGSPYEEDIHLPLLVRGPGVPSRQVVHNLAINIDLAPTIAELAGVPTPAFVDGRSLVPLLGSEPVPLEEWRQSFLIENWSDYGQLRLDYQGLRTQDYLYVEWYTGEVEFYHLPTDRNQLRSLHATADPALLESFSNRLRDMSSCRRKSCRRLENEPIELVSNPP